MKDKIELLIVPVVKSNSPKFRDYCFLVILIYSKV